MTKDQLAGAGSTSQPVSVFRLVRASSRRYPLVHHPSDTSRCWAMLVCGDVGQTVATAQRAGLGARDKNIARVLVSRGRQRKGSATYGLKVRCRPAPAPTARRDVAVSKLLFPTRAPTSSWCTAAQAASLFGTDTCPDRGIRWSPTGKGPSLSDGRALVQWSPVRVTVLACSSRRGRSTCSGQNRVSPAG